MPAHSSKQQTAASMALAMKRGEMPHKPGPAHEMMKSMSASQLHHYASSIKRPKSKRGGQ